MNLLPEKYRQHQEQKKKQKKEFRLVASGVPHPNHKVWEINLITGEVKLATAFKKNIHWSAAVKGKFRSSNILVKENCAYVFALNPENALKKYNKNSNGAKFTKVNSKINLF